MRKVLMIAYQFPPVGGSGVQRSAKFAKYLPLFGWEPVVLTRADTKMNLRDTSLLEELPKDLEIIRTPAYDLTVLPSILNKVGKFIAWKILIPDGEVLWMKKALPHAIERLSKGDIEAVYTTSYPYSSHLMGLELKKSFPDIPWIADFRDEWTNNPYLLDNPHMPYRMKKEKEMECEVLREANALITNTPIMKENFVRLNPDLDLEKRMTVIPNGYDSDDFADLRGIDKNNSRFTLTYTGALYGRRKPDKIIEAIGKLVSAGKIDKNKIRIRFIGSFKPEVIKELINRNGLEGAVDLISYMEHQQCIIEMVKSDAMLLIEGGGPGSEAFYTGKIFEYIQTSNPILAVIPANGAAADIIRRTKTGIVCDWEDEKAIQQGFTALYEAWLKGDKIISPDNEEIARFDRKELTRNLAELLNLQIGRISDEGH
ncbi:MAG: glycosyltransferase family 4 protein [Clostridiaceae bacterium]|nr:glycosyltransferase family 4 protein [Clostridiaceae bacterium]